MKRTPLIILNGFLGAGKTTLLKNLLTQAHKRRMAVSVIVNDMSELDVDGVLIANTEIVDAASNNFVSISADSISSRSGIQKLDSALKNLLEKRSPDFILLETSGSSHPLPLVRYLREHPQVSLKAFLSLVDTVMLNDDYDGGKKLIPVFQEHLNRGTRGVESLLAEQIHPQRLWDTCHRFMGAGVYRSKGFFWLPGRDDLALLWNQAAGSINLEFISYWKAGVLTHTDNSLTKEERAAIRQQLAKMPGRFGDRRCRLTVIGESGEIDDFALALRQCLLTEEEILWWQQGGIFHDPWPTKVARLA
ncbi:GTP-binding protein [Klebsiella pneumoniae]|nr:GTP-binding protein [Klebsiella pneumoniae]